jgi:hypothetical protein
MFVPSLTYDPFSMIVPSSIPNFSTNAHILVSSSNENNDNENPPMPAHLPPIGSIEQQLALASEFPRWICHNTRRNW